MTKNVLLPALVLAAAGAVPATAMAETTANFGWVSEYIFRGIYQEDSSAYAGVDLNHDTGFYIGAWGADVGTGTEIDYYLGWGGGEDITYSVGYTFYTYPDNFDEKYEEVNLGVCYGIFALDYAIGKYKSVPAAAALGLTGSDVNYTFTSLTITPEMGPYFKVGLWGDDFEEYLVTGLADPSRTGNLGDEASYVEVGYVYTMEEFGVDLSIAMTITDENKFPFVTNSADGDGSANYALTFGLSKNFVLDE
jgi:uncharacterized protein (TIGR02001 family)